MMSNMMRALVKAKAEPGIWMEQVPVPEIGPNDVLIKVKKTAICGTDVHIYNWDQWAQKTVPVPMVTGHEFVGTVADFGAAVTEYKVGQRVSGEGHIVCGHCRNCRAGQRASLPQHAGRRRQPAGRLRRISVRSRSTMSCRSPTTCPTRSPRSSIRSAMPCTPRCPSTWSARTCWSPAPGRSASWARWSRKCVGARKVVITDINPTRLALATKLGVQHVVDASKEKLRDVMRDDRHDAKASTSASKCRARRPPSAT